MATRMRDIAEALGVSIVTVSKALRDHPDVAKGTRQRVLDAAKEMHYRPNLMARSLVTGRSSLVGMLVPDLIHPFFAEIANSVSAALRAKGFFLIVCSSEGDPKLERAEIEQMLSHHLGALIVASSQSTGETLSQIQASGPPLILIDRTVPGLRTHFVGSDDFRIGEIAAEHLIRSGKTRIAHIRGPRNNVGEQRLAGYRATLERHNLSLPEQYVILPKGDLDNNGETCGSEAMEQLLQIEPRPDAVFCFNDLLGMGAMTHALRKGLLVPDDIAYIGCGNDHYSGHLQVPLSSVDQKIEEFGNRIAKVVVTLVGAKGPQRTRRIVLEPSLIVRGSTCNACQLDRPVALAHPPQYA